MTQLTPGQQQFVDAQVALGKFSQPSEVIGAALQLLGERQIEYDQLKVALEQVERGELEPLDLADIKRRGRERKAAQ